nr:HDOD domain-containing protein [Schlegelella koreensis]
MLEVPAFMASDPELLPALRALHANGNELLLKGRARHDLPKEVLACFAYAAVDSLDELHGAAVAPAPAPAPAPAAAAARPPAVASAAARPQAVASAAPRAQAASAGARSAFSTSAPLRNPIVGGPARPGVAPARPGSAVPARPGTVVPARPVAAAAPAPVAAPAPATAAVAPPNGMPQVLAGVRTIVDMDAAFAKGAAAVLGWPIHDEIAALAPSNAAKTDLTVIAELIRRVDQEEPIEKLDNTLKGDPSLAFKLLRYINSPAFGLHVEVSSFRHAIMLLGYGRLKRWLALLLATASKDANQKPAMFAAVRRGLLMEELVRGSGDEEMRSEAFICGVFSLLDRMFQESFEKLLANIPVPDRVHQALVGGSGPFQPYLAMIKAIEGESPSDFREAADTLLMGVAEVNSAQLRALVAAGALE